MSVKSSQVLPPPPSYGTGLMDRMNIFMHILKAMRFILRRWWIFLLCLLATGGFAGYKAFTLADTFESTAYLAPPPTMANDVSGVNEGLNVGREREIIFESALINKINQHFQDYRSPNGSKPIPHINIMPGQGTFDFKLIVTSSDPKFAQDYVIMWADEVIKAKREMADLVKNSKLTEISKSIAEQEDELESIKSQIEAFLRKNKNVDSSKGYGNYTKLQDDRRELEGRIEKLNIELSMIQQSNVGDAFEKYIDTYGADVLFNASNQGSGDSSQELFSRDEIQLAVDLRRSISNLTAEHTRYAVDLKSEHPFMQKLDKELETLKRSFNQQSIAFNSKLKAKEQSLRSQLTSMTTRSADIQFKIDELRPLQKQYDDLVSQQRLLEKSVQLKKDRLSDDRESSPMLNLEVLYSGSPARRIGPHRPLILAGGIVAGFILAGVLVFFLGKLDDRLELAEDIERELQEHVLGQIPKITTPPAGKSRFLITDLGLHDMFCESLRGVRSAFKYYTKGNRKIRSLVVTSAVPGDGKSTFTVNFGATLAMAGNKVLLIDADLRRGSVNEYFDFKRSGGLSDVLSGRVHWLDVTRETQIPNLDVITTGKLPMNPGELLSSQVVPVMIQQAYEEYDYVIIDCPPLTAIDDAFSVFEFVDTGLFVVRAGQTSLRFIKNALHELDKRGQSILGIILNGITTADPSYYYAKYYHSYYNKDLPSSVIESASVYQPASAMPEPKRRQPRKNTSTPRPNPTTTEESIGTSPAPSDITQSTESQKAVRYKPRRTYRAGNNESESNLAEKSDS